MEAVWTFFLTLYPSNILVNPRKTIHWGLWEALATCLFQVGESQEPGLYKNTRKQSGAHIRMETFNLWDLVTSAQTRDLDWFILNWGYTAASITDWPACLDYVETFLLHTFWSVLAFISSILRDRWSDISTKEIKAILFFLMGFSVFLLKRCVYLVIL